MHFQKTISPKKTAPYDYILKTAERIEPKGGFSDQAPWTSELHVRTLSKDMLLCNCRLLEKIDRHRQSSRSSPARLWPNIINLNVLKNMPIY